MDISLALGIASVVISVIALTVTAVLTGRQAHAAQAQVVVEFSALLRSAADPSFVSDVEYIRTYLTSRSSAPCRIAELPDEVRPRFRRVTNYFDQLGLLRAHDAMDASLIIGYIGNWIDQIWRAAEPWIHMEREHRSEELRLGESTSGNYLAYFEDLVVRARRTSPPVVQREQHLLTVDHDSPRTDLPERDVGE
jgi:hypothetical protein